MSSSKNYYDSIGWSLSDVKEDPIFEVGQRFTKNFGYNKSERGTWEIVSVKDSPLYECVRVLKNGNLSKSKSLNNKRAFHVSTIKQSLGMK